MSDTDASRHHEQDSSAIGTIKQLIFAFVLAMTFRGFVTEGFVIPTGSMAPTLYGQHLMMHSEQTGYQFAVGYAPGMGRPDLDKVADPMLGPAYRDAAIFDDGRQPRMGDRILVVKSLYPFAQPDRFDVVVFKNPTNPNGPDGNYIKRLIGLPGESIWLVDGDVFAGSAETAGNHDRYRIRRKPEYVQRAVWQPVYNSEFIPTSLDRLRDRGFRYIGSPWLGANWDTSNTRAYRCDTAEPTTLEWANQIQPLTDWAPYNALTPGTSDRPVYVNDLRVAATVVPDEPGLTMTLELEARNHVYQFTIGSRRAVLRMRESVWEGEGPELGWQGPEQPFAIEPLPPGEPTNVEFWHVDQSLKLFINGDRVASFEYDWRPPTRLQYAAEEIDDVGELAAELPANPAQIRWHFQNAPLTLHRVQVDRDLYYRTDRLNKSALKNPNPPYPEGGIETSFAYGTHPENLAVLGPDHFFMLGDNSAASSDSRLWGNPHPLVATQIDPHPFIVDRRLLLGKAWVVYFPAPHSLTPGGRSIIPDFGRLRFIR
jgi:signal peptidase I